MLFFYVLLWTLSSLLVWDIHCHHGCSKLAYYWVWWDLHIPALHLLIKTMHIQRYGGHADTEAPMKFPRLDAFSESLTLQQWRAGRQFSSAGSTRKREIERSEWYDFTVVLIFPLHLSHHIPKQRCGYLRCITLYASPPITYLNICFYEVSV